MTGLDKLPDDLALLSTGVLKSLEKLGRDAFSRESVPGLVSHVLNNSSLAAPIARSCLVDLRGRRPRVLGVSGQSSVNAHSPYCAAAVALLEELEFPVDPFLATADNLRLLRAPSSSLTAAKEGFSTVPAVLSLRNPRDSRSRRFVWLVELDVPDAATARRHWSALVLLSERYAEALWSLVEFSPRLVLSARAVGSSAFRPWLLFLLALSSFLAALVFWEVPEQVSCEFEVVPERRAITYAPFTGTVEDAEMDPGEEVAAGDEVLRYDTRGLLVDLAVAEKKLQEIQERLELARTESFRDVKARGSIKVLELRRRREENELDKLRWHLERSVVRAGSPGVLVIDDRHVWPGRKVEAGEKLFEVIPPVSDHALALLDERDGYLLRGLSSVVLYPHLRPETGLTAKVLSVSPVPLLSPDHRYRYRVKLQILDPPSELEFFPGSRGVARVYGKRVPLGKHLFRNLLIWWRSL